MNLTSYSQAGQDIFALSATKKKIGGTFLEIGANHPKDGGNNTYLLETQWKWSGVMVEFDRQFGPLYQQYRPLSKYIIGDARTIDYKAFLDTNQFPKSIDYLQIDLDVNNRSTLDTLELLDRTVFDTYTFATVTFEHDIYTGDYFSTREISRQIFAKRGYVLVFPDVKVNSYGNYFPYEDWYVHPSLVDLDYIEKWKTEHSLPCDTILMNLKNSISENS